MLLLFYLFKFWEPLESKEVIEFLLYEFKDYKLPAKTPACFMILSLVAVWAALTAAAAAVEVKASFEWKFNCS